MEDYIYFTYLLKKYINNELNEEERDVFYDLIKTNHYDNVLSDEIFSTLKANAADSRIDLDSSESRELLNQILDRQKKRINTYSFVSSKFFTIIVSIAALLVIVFFVWLSIKKQSSGISPTSDLVTEQHFLEHLNQSDTIQKLILSDLSNIAVYPNATLRYPETFTGPERKVYLKGKAFFSVSSDSIHPFVVYSGNLKTSVLGTSFFINSDRVLGVDEVEVSTGRVRVTEFRDGGNTKQSEEQFIILAPNQRGVFRHEGRVLQKTLVRAPKPISFSGKTVKSNPDVHSFEYDQTLLTKVVSDLQSNYGVNIRMENAQLADCTFTGNLTDIDLFKKLKIICLTTQSSFEVVGTDIIIKGKGCKNPL